MDFSQITFATAGFCSKKISSCSLTMLSTALRATEYAEEAIEEKRFEFLFVYFAVAVLVLHDKVGKSEADNP